MKILIIYFTGTFNTLYLVNKIKERLIKEDSTNEITTFAIDIDSKRVDLSFYELIIFSYPIYAFNMPKIFIKYIKKLKFLPNKKYIIAKQSGEPISFNNSSSYPLISLIKRNKGTLLNEYHFLMPYNIHFRYPDNFIKELFNYDKKLLEILIYELKNNIVTKIKKNLIYSINSNIFKIQRLGGTINSYLYKIDYSKCIHCNKCINNCPTHNIFLNKDNKLRFKHNCLMCMRCSFYCPKDAINIGFLKKWKINGAYDLDKITKDRSLKGDYLINNHKGFYSLFPKKIEKINNLYNKYFN